MTKRNGRSVYTCRDCKTKLAFVRGDPPNRRLSAIPPVKANFRELDGTLELECPSCHKVNWFSWVRNEHGTMTTTR